LSKIGQENHVVFDRKKPVGNRPKYWVDKEFLDTLVHSLQTSKFLRMGVTERLLKLSKKTLDADVCRRSQLSTAEVFANQNQPPHHAPEAKSPRRRGLLNLDIRGMRPRIKNTEMEV